MELFEAIEQDRADMLQAVQDAREDGIKLANAEAEYQRIKAEKALEMKADGMAATMVNLCIKGDYDVNLALLKRDCAQVEYETAREAVNAYKLSARLQENQLQREWTMAGGQL